MRILSLDLLAFGPFTDVSLPLDEGHYGLHVIYGANEAGKSSALRALSQFFYGIPHNSSDNFIHTNQNMRIGATLRHSTGNVLECIRRKGQKKTLRAADDEQVIDDQRIAELQHMEAELRELHRLGLTFPTDEVDGKNCVCHLVSEHPLKS